MNLATLAAMRAEEGRPVRAGLIGAGKFGSMFLSQVPTTLGLEVAAVADLSVDRARAACRTVGWPDEMIEATAFVEDGAELAARDDIEVVIEATGNPPAGVRHALAAIENGKHIVMVNVEADVLAGAALSRRADEAGVVYSMGYGDQPALVSEMVDWARACGFRVMAAGKGTRYLPGHHELTPEGIWERFGFDAAACEADGMNPQMYNSFMDGTKSAIEMAAIANACGLAVPSDGLSFTPCGVDDLAEKLRPRPLGGVLEGPGMVEVVSDLERDGTQVDRHLRWGVYVVIEAPNDYAASCFDLYGLSTDSTGQYAATYKPFHLIGMELNISVFSAALRGEPTGQTLEFRGDPVAVAKRDLAIGDTLDGEGGYTVWGKLWPAEKSVAYGALPIGLAHGVKLTKPVKRGETVRWSDVAIEDNLAVSMRREMEGMLGEGNA